MPLRLSITIEAEDAGTETRILETLRELVAEADEVVVGSRGLRAGGRWASRTEPASAPPDLLGLVQKLAPGSHTEFATTAAFIAETKGLPGLDVTTIDAWSHEVGWDQPADWRFILANATRSGYLQTVGRGMRALAPKGRSLIEERFAIVERRPLSKATH